MHKIRIHSTCIEERKRNVNEKIAVDVCRKIVELPRVYFAKRRKSVAKKKKGKKKKLRAALTSNFLRSFATLRDRNGWRSAD